MSDIEDNSALSREELLCRKFDYMRQALLTSKSGLLDTSAEVLALDAIELLAKVVLMGQPTKIMLSMLADFLDSVLDRSEQSGTAWDAEVELANRILGHQPKGRPNNIRAMSRAVAAFDMHHDEGRGTSIAEAERASYDAYQAALGHPEKTYEASNSRMVTVTRGANAVTVTDAERLLDSTIRPALRKAGLLPLATRGRKPKSSAKPHP